MHAVAAGFRSRAARLAELRLLALRGYSAPASAAPAADDETRAALGYCVQLVRKYDYDNYIWATQLPKEHRPAVFALRAFNVETGTIADQIKSGEAALGRVRFQWWRDALAGAFKGVPPKHPVMLALASVLKSKPDIKAYHLR